MLNSIGAVLQWRLCSFPEKLLSKQIGTSLAKRVVSRKAYLLHVPSCVHFGHFSLSKEVWTKKNYLFSCRFCP